MLRVILLLLRSARNRRSGGLDMVAHPLNFRGRSFGHYWILCQRFPRFLLRLRLGHLLQLTLNTVQFLALWMVERRIVQKAFGGSILMIQSRMLLAMIQPVPEATRRQMIYPIIIGVRSMTRIIIILAFTANASRSIFRPLQGQRMSAQMH